MNRTLREKSKNKEQKKKSKKITNITQASKNTLPLENDKTTKNKENAQNKIPRRQIKPQEKTILNGIHGENNNKEMHKNNKNKKSTPRNNKTALGVRKNKEKETTKPQKQHQIRTKNEY